MAVNRSSSTTTDSYGQSVNTSSIRATDTYGFAANSTLVADVNGGALKGSITGYSSGSGVAGERAGTAFTAELIGDNNDTGDMEYISYDAGEFTSNGGSAEAVAFNIGTGFTVGLIMASGSIEFEDYSLSIGGVQSEDTDQNGFDLNITGMDGYDSGAVARNGGNITLKGGEAANAGSDGYVKVGGVISPVGTVTNDDLVVTGRMQAGGGINTAYSTANVSDPPTDAEIDAAFGAPITLGAGFIGIIDDNDAGADGDVWLCTTTGTDAEWFYVSMTKAV